MKKKPSFNIPEDIQNKFPEVVEMILEAESMNDIEKEYWIKALPVMTIEQIDNLKVILEDEIKAIKTLNEQYKINEDGEIEGPSEAEENRKKREYLRKLEEKEEESETKEQEDLLSGLE